jgi:nicotinamidase-related amidase
MANSALLVMDVQRDVVAIADDGSGYLPRLRRAIDGARAAGIPVIYVVIGLRPGDPEVSPRNKVMTNAVRAGLFTEGAPGTEIHPDITPQQGDVVVPRGEGARSRAATSTWCSGLATSTALCSPASPPAP